MKLLPPIPASLAALLALSACTQPQLDKAKADAQKVEARVVPDGQLFCAKVLPVGGPIVVALANAAGVPVLVTGAASSVVSKACALIDAIPVVPPPVPSAAPVVAAPVVGLPTAPIS